MHSLTKYEFNGIALSIIVMILTLVVLHEKTNILSSKNDTHQTPEIKLVTEENTHAKSLEESLIDSRTAKGDFVKLIINDVALGTGERSVVNGDTISVNYIGQTTTGIQFDNSFKRGEPFTFTIGQGRVIKGWEEGFIGMKVGGKRILVIPADMAYGNRQVGNIPANSPLIFAVELVAIK